MPSRWVEVDPERLPRWVEGFFARHGPSTVDIDGYAVSLCAADGETATCHAPPGAPPPVSLADFLATATQPRRVGLLLVRRGGYAVGVAVGAALIASKVDSRYVQARTAAGGWSQQRFARRRDNQTRALTGAAAEVASRLLLPEAGRLAALVGGGDRRLVEVVLSDPRLGPLRTLRAERFLDVPDPRLTVLEAAVSRARAVRIRLDQPPLPNVSQDFGAPVE
jgi:hypothetical protein